MSRVEEELSAIAEMVAVELGSDRAEVDLWKELVRAVDVKRLRRTGEIVVRDDVLEMATTDTRQTFRRHMKRSLSYNPSEVRAAMEQLRRRVRTTSVDRTSRLRDRSVPDIDEPNYDSTDTELWLFGPLS